MVGGSNGHSPHSDALRGEIELLRAAVSALRATRARAAATTPCTRAVVIASVISFAAGVMITVAAMLLSRG